MIKGVSDIEAAVLASLRKSHLPSLFSHRLLPKPDWAAEDDVLDQPEGLLDGGCSGRGPSSGLNLTGRQQRCLHEILLRIVGEGHEYSRLWKR